MFKILFHVLEDDIASTDDAAAKGLLSSLLGSTIPYLMSTLDVLDHAVAFSVCSQFGNFSVFHYIDQREQFVNVMKIMAEESFNVNVNKPGTTDPLSARLKKYEDDIKKLEINTISLVPASS